LNDLQNCQLAPDSLWNNKKRLLVSNGDLYISGTNKRGAVRKLRIGGISSFRNSVGLAGDESVSILSGNIGLPSGLINNSSDFKGFIHVPQSNYVYLFGNTNRLFRYDLLSKDFHAIKIPSEIAELDAFYDKSIDADIITWTDTMANVYIDIIVGHYIDFKQEEHVSETPAPPTGQAAARALRARPVLVLSGM